MTRVRRLGFCGFSLILVLCTVALVLVNYADVAEKENREISDKLLRLQESRAIRWDRIRKIGQIKKKLAAKLEKSRRIPGKPHPYYGRFPLLHGDAQVLCPKDAPILFVVHSASFNIDRRQTIRETWAHKKWQEKFGFRVFFVVGTSDYKDENDMINEEAVFNRDILQYDFTDHYRNLTIKYLSWMRFVREECPNVELILKLDDDALPNIFWFFQDFKPNKIDMSNRLLCGKLQVDQLACRWEESPWYVANEAYTGGKAWPPFCTGLAVLQSFATLPKLIDGAEKREYYLSNDDVLFTGLIPKEVGIEIEQGKNFTCNSEPVEESERKLLQERVMIGMLNNMAAMRRTFDELQHTLPQREEPRGVRIVNPDELIKDKLLRLQESRAIRWNRIRKVLGIPGKPHPYYGRFPLLHGDAQGLCPKDAPILFVVHSASSNIDRRQTIRETWAHKKWQEKFGFRAFFVVGTSDYKDENDMINEEAVFNRDILQYDFTDHYRKLTIKYLSWMRFVREECPNVELILKLDVDQLACRWEESPWYVANEAYTGGKAWPPFCTGLAVLQSFATLPKLIDGAEKREYYLSNDDVLFTGLIPKEVGIEIEQGKNFTCNSEPVEESERKLLQERVMIGMLNNMAAMRRTFDELQRFNGFIVDKADSFPRYYDRTY
ncbi:unnamed protein product, partial [Mesorhabditis belari]|uniref:Hexosyltransferase n=1 Tax=Mesorhabditis belari TaxID=2138241 RepID=A0AAF3EDX8_9BILA